jgi:outer membrane biosynthesis protein TonB
MTRSEGVGLGVALLGHVLLFGLLSVGFLSTPNPVKLNPTPVEVSLVDEVGLEAAAPQSTVAPAQSVAPELGPPEDAAPPEPAPDVAPDPVPPAPQPEPAPQPRPEPPKPQPKPEPAKPTKPAEKPKPKPAPAKPAPAEPKAKPAPTKPAAPASSSKATKPSPPKPAAAAKPATKPAADKGSGSDQSPRRRPGGSRLGPDFLKGIADTPSTSTSQVPRAATISATALAGITDAIRRQIQPCADRQVNPGPGANEIVTVLNLRFNPDGTLAATPRMVRQAGVTPENERYSQRVADLGIAALKGCSPLKLPAQYYETANGGWSNINYNWQLR